MGGTAAGAVEMPMDGFVTKPDPGVGCRDPVHPVVGVCVHKTKDDGEPEELWLEHNNFYSDEGHCTSDGGGSSDGTRRLAATTTTTTTTHGHRNRSLRGAGTGGAAAMGGASAGEDNDSKSLSSEDMAGTLLLQIVGSAIAIVVAIVSRFDPNTEKEMSQRRASINAELRKKDEDEANDVTESTVRGHLHELKTRRVDALASPSAWMLSPTRWKDSKTNRTNVMQRNTMQCTVLEKVILCNMTIDV
uniref:Uncharacterized protein n=1 Tax=Pseudo-nitzschia australis TaxID=44445 RepID=A0A6V0C4U3_9STRA